MCKCGVCPACLHHKEQAKKFHLEHIGSDITMYWVNEIQYATGVGDIAMACMMQEEYSK